MERLILKVINVTVWDMREMTAIQINANVQLAYNAAGVRAENLKSLFHLSTVRFIEFPL